ncbi:MAG: cell envelope integrity protein TolA [Nitrospiraceae bacterium]|nr:MAG: cell envelope integrity protein TolA [Nitrospiraceae bacterium]
MKYALHIGKEPNFQAIVATSAIIHLVLIALIVIPLRSKEHEYTSYFVNLVGPAETAREKTSRPPAVKEEKKESTSVKELKAPEVKPQPKADMALEQAEQVSKEIERLRALSALSKQKEKKETEKARDIEIIKQNVRQNALKGAGIPGNVQSLASDSYYALITRKIWSEWIYPEFGATGLEVIISVKIERDGRIVSHDIERSSGNVLFDRSAMKAVAKASPLPAPPFEMEIGVRFYL